MSELILISVFGENKPGIIAELTARLTELLNEYPVDILDIGQSVIHNHLSLGILVSLPAEPEAGLQPPPSSEQVYKALTSKATALDIKITFSPVSEASYQAWVEREGRSRLILTLLARRIRAVHIAEVSCVITGAGLDIDHITRLSGRVPLHSGREATNACVEFSLRGEPEEHFREKLLALCSALDIDVAVQADNLYRRHRRLIAFDMDSTLIKTEVIDELAELAGAGAEVKSITEQTMSKHLDFGESLRQRVALLKGLPETALVKVADALPLMDGAERLFRTLNHLGYKTAILSGGFEYFGEILQQRLGIDYMFANRLEIVDGKLTGRVTEPIVDAERKAGLLRELADREKIALQQTIAVGDGANDLAMLDAAGLGIAFHAKPMIRESAGQAISNFGLDSLLYLMGIRHRDAQHH